MNAFTNRRSILSATQVAAKSLLGDPQGGVLPSVEQGDGHPVAVLRSQRRVAVHVVHLQQHSGVGGHPDQHLMRNIAEMAMGAGKQGEAMFPNPATRLVGRTHAGVTGVSHEGSAAGRDRIAGCALGRGRLGDTGVDGTKPVRADPSREGAANAKKPCSTRR